MVIFFSDDLTALAELLALFGTKAVQETANQYGKRLICSEQVPGQDLQLLCQTLAERKPSEYKNPEPGNKLILISRKTNITIYIDFMIFLFILTRIFPMSCN